MIVDPSLLHSLEGACLLREKNERVVVVNNKVRLLKNNQGLFTGPNDTYHDVDCNKIIKCKPEKESTKESK